MSSNNPATFQVFFGPSRTPLKRFLFDRPSECPVDPLALCYALSSEAYKQWRQLGFDLAPIGSWQATPASSKPKSTKGLLFIVASLLRGERTTTRRSRSNRRRRRGSSREDRFDWVWSGLVWYAAEDKCSCSCTRHANGPTGYCKSRRALERNCNKGNSNSNSSSTATTTTTTTRGADKTFYKTFVLGC